MSNSRNLQASFSFLRFVAVAVTLCSMASVTIGQQLRTVPIPREAGSTPKTKSASNKKKNADPLTLPFWDDFSFTSAHFSPDDPQTAVPNDSLWENSYDVWVKTGIDIDAPTINVANLDGLDSAGNAYSTDPQENGIRDVLTSRPIDMGTQQVTMAERSSVFLSFFYQWKGNGEPPDKLDNFSVEFLAEDEESWITVATITPTNDFQSDIFYDTVIQVSGEEFFHENFRFRFRSYGRMSGPFDTWNIDYVYLDKGRTADDNSFDDGALASPAGPLFGNYFGIPYPHFLRTAMVGNVGIDVLNLRTNQTNPDPYTYRTTGSFTNFVDGTPVTTEVLLTSADRPVRPGNPLLGPRERFTIETLPSDQPDPTDTIQFRRMADSVAVKLKFLLLSNDNGFYQSNDTVSASYFLKDYYAYDDGTAEYAVSVNDNDDQVVLGFEMAGTEPDLLIGFDIYIPRHNISGFQTADFIVMDAEGNAPRDVISSVTQSIRQTARDEFQRITLSRPVIVQDRFFIGWKGSFVSILFVGKDTDTDASANIWVNPSGGWIPNTTVTGTLMIRPVFGPEGTIVGNEKEEATAFDIYPNPSRGSFYVTGNPDQIEVIAPSGAQVPFRQEKHDDRVLVTLSSAHSGVMILIARKGGIVETRKIILH
jgi:hypothetical protein